MISDVAHVALLAKFVASNLRCGNLFAPESIFNSA